ncbi:hypothetical protein HYH02_014915 [Chlamydomonas schloesseri]|uniref:PX domain-containing protein n=1 Tax=Chlamydomonas schloesseri TaxID=2026947 RepID=A0A835SU63_9CHLO|nr:hypothetical protein HYH02_014915 [Chlamydomonas schloesseri]|eukprot:KAG2425916.1 hypothetical protein HYH02_014915 [Chlamydomonas schloesseri]
MDDPLNATVDPLDELGGLVGETLNLFDAPVNPGSANRSPATHGGLPAQHSDSPGFGAAGPRSSPDAVAQSIDLDLLGGGPGVTSSLVTAPTGAPEVDVPLIAEDDVTLGFGYEPPSQQQPQKSFGVGPLGHVEPLSHSAAAHVSSVSAAAAAQPSPRNSYRELQPDDGPSTSAGAGPSTSAGGASTSAAASAAPPIRVWVRDPERNEAPNKLGIRTTYFTYLVRTESVLPGMRTDGTEVRRRFSEFDALHKLVKAHYRGYIIPPLPEKSFIDAKLAHEDFLRLRRADLQAFLRGIVNHPALRDAEALKLFLLQPGELHYNPAWIGLLHSIGSSPDGQESLVGALGVSVGGGGGGSAGAKAAAGFNSLVAWVRHSVGVGGGPRRELDEDEQQLRHAKELMRDLERLLQLCCESARVMCGHMEALAADMYELGRNMGMLSKWEETLRAHSGTYTEAGYSASKRAADCKQLSYATARQHTMWKSASVKTAASLVALHDYYIIMPEAVAALEERERCLDQIHELEADLAAKQAELSKSGGAAGRGLQGRQTQGDRRAYTLTNAVDKLEEQLKVCRDTYALIKGRNMEELRRLHLSREADFHAMMCHYSAVQAQLMQASADMWRTTARQFAGEPVEGSGISADGDSPRQDD